MKLFIKAITVVVLLKGFLFADYVSTKEYNIFFNTSKEVVLEGAEFREVYFGLSDGYFNEEFSKNTKNVLSVIGAPYMVASTIVSTSVLAVINPSSLMKLGNNTTVSEPIFYIYAVDIKDKNGVETRGVAMFMTKLKKYQEPSEEVLKEVYSLTRGVFIK